MYAASEPHSQVVDPGDRKQRDHRQGLHPGEFEMEMPGLSNEVVIPVPHPDGGGHRRHQKCPESHQPGRNRGCRRRPRDNRMRPAKQEPRGRIEALGEVRVLAARLGDRRAQLGVGQSAKERQYAAHDPRRIHDADRPCIAGHLARLQENPRADHRANDDRNRGRSAQPTNQIERLFFLRHDPESLSREERHAAARYDQAS